MFGHNNRARLVAAASIFCVAISLSASASAQDDSAKPKEADAGDIVITGSRITAIGMKAPTPVTAVSSVELTALSPSTTIAALSKLPQFVGNTTNDARTGFFSSPGEGNLNLRGLNTLSLIHI